MTIAGRLGFLFGERKQAQQGEAEMPIDDASPIDTLIQGQATIEPEIHPTAAAASAPSAAAFAPPPAAALDAVRAELDDLTSAPRRQAAPAAPPPPAAPIPDAETLLQAPSETGGAGTDISAELASELKQLITNALRRQYISTSSHMDYKTGNAYQAVDLGEGAIGGYRQDRSNLFDAFDFTGRRVLDCGCNIGELSRQARRRGAVLVDGIEYDSYFVRIAQLISAYRSNTRVSFSQGDLTKPGTIKDEYDVSMAFSVFPYILPTLEQLTAATREVLILETHDVSANLKPLYLKTVSKYFPYHSFVAFTDFGHGKGQRAVIMFAKQAKSLNPGGILSSTVDLTRSTFGFVDAMMEIVRQVAPGPARTVADIERVVAQAGDVPDDIAKLTAGRTYWLRMMQGYVMARQHGQVTLDNLYVQTLRSCLREQGFDPALSATLESDEALLERVRFRFADIDRIAAGGEGLAPVTILDFLDANGRYTVYNGSVESVVRADKVDGYHRLFWAKFFSVAKVPGLYQIR